MAQFSRQFLDELLERNDIVDIVGNYVSLTPKSSNLFGLCPFHNEKTASFSVSPSKQIYKCFGCNKGGTVINFIMEIENLSFPDAVSFLAKRAGMEIPDSDGNDDYRKKKDRLLKLNKDAARFFYENLQGEQGKAVQDYLNKRKISKTVAVNFGMGASLPSWDSLIRAMEDKGYTKAELLEVGLVSENKGKIYDKFRNRLMLPVINEKGDVVGFGSRVIDGSEPKYMNTTETPVYRKRQVLYGLNLAKKTKRPNIILCEGNLDVVTLHQAGFDNAVASMGTALTSEQINLLSRYTKEVVLCYDNDEAGQKATKRALELLNQADMRVKVLKLPMQLIDGQYKKQDADDFIKNRGKEAFENLLSGSGNSTEFQIADIAARYNLTDDTAKIDYAKEAAQFLSGLHNSVERDIYTRKIAEQCGISYDAMDIEVKRAYKKKMGDNKRMQERKETNVSQMVQPKERGIHYTNPRSAVAEEGIIRLLEKCPEIFNGQKPVEGSCFSSPLLGKVFDLMWENRDSGNHYSCLIQELTNEEMNHITSVFEKPEDLVGAKKALSDYLKIIQECGQNDEDPLLRAMKNSAQKKK